MAASARRNIQRGTSRSCKTVAGVEQPANEVARGTLHHDRIILAGGKLRKFAA